jgi:hypothetical protein
MNPQLFEVAFFKFFIFGASFQLAADWSAVWSTFFASGAARSPRLGPGPRPFCLDLGIQAHLSPAMQEGALKSRLPLAS